LGNREILLIKLLSHSTSVYAASKAINYASMVDHDIIVCFAYLQETAPPVNVKT